MTGSQLKKIRIGAKKQKDVTVKKFYEKLLGYTYYTQGLNLERFAEVPQETIERLKGAGFDTGGKK